MTPPDALDGTARVTAPGADARHWAEVAATAADDKLAVDTVILDVGDVLAVTDLFVITSGTNPRQVRAIVDEVEARVAEQGGPRPVRVEGRDTREWVLLDYGAFVVHVFDEKTRAHYQLERLWGDRPRWRPGRSSSTAPGS
ncbi:MAG: ribosome silencing factor [Actinomyces sp.]|nr:MAG: ribosome silencing factor [Actinomyces sp.]